MICACAYVILISVMCGVDNDIFTVVVASLSVLLSIFGLGELHLGKMFGIWSLWYATSKQIPAMLDDRYSLSSVPVICISLWVAFGGEQKMFTHIRPSMSVLLILLNVCVGFTIRDKNKVELRTAYTILFGLASAGLVLIDKRRNHPSATGYHLLATTWMITTTPGSVDHPFAFVGFIARVAFTGLVVYRFVIVVPTIPSKPTVAPPKKKQPKITTAAPPPPPPSLYVVPPPKKNKQTGGGGVAHYHRPVQYNSNIVNAFLKNDSDDEYAGTSREKVMEAKEKIKSQL